MQVLVDVKGHGYVPDAKVAAIQEAVEALKAACEAGGLPLRADVLATSPEGGA